MLARAALALLFTAATLARLPSMAAAQDAGPTVQPLPSSDSGSAQCGADQVVWNNMRTFAIGSTGVGTLRATAPDRRVVLELTRSLAPGERLMPRWCGDLLGDGTQVLAFEIFSGGAHCCFTATIVALQPGGRELLHVALGNGGLGQPQQLGDSGPLEVITSSDVFAYFDDLSFAASPFMPLIFAYNGSQYVEATRQFPDELSADIDGADAALDQALQRRPKAPAALQYQEQESIALRLYGLHVLLGDADAALPRIQARVAPAVAAWLAANAPAALDAMSSVYDLSSPTSGPPFEW
jgi:hypothetical protein